MSGDALPPDVDPSVLGASVFELNRALDSLRERLNRLERSAGQGSSSPLGEERLDPERHTLSIFQEILSIPASGLRPGELFVLAVDRAARLLAADRAMLFVAESQHGRLVPRSGRGFRRDDLEAISIGAGEGIVGRVFREKRVLVTGGDEPIGEDPFLEAFPVRDAIAVPVRVEGEVVGVLYVGRRGLGTPFGTSDILLLLVIADRVGAALVHEGLLGRRGAEVARLREIEGLAAESVVGGDAADLLARACEAGCRLLGVRSAAIALGAESEDLMVRAACGLRPDTAGARVSPREGLTAELYASRSPVACRDLRSRQVPEADVLGETELQSCLLVPLGLRGRVLGVLYLADTETRDFSVEQLAAAQALGTLTVAALESARVHGDLRSAFEDALTSHGRLVEKEKARALGEMAGGLAREFNNIFAIILGKTQLLLARTHDDPLREGLGTLEEAAWRGADIVHRLLGLAATAMEETATPVDMAALVQDAVALTRARWKDEPESRGMRIDMVVELESAPSVGANPTALREAVMGLLVNAVDAMPQGGRLGVRTRPKDGGVELVVEDTGEGISEDVRRRMFAPFFTTRAPLRLGLGLAVVQAVVAHYGGRVEVVSAPAQGTRVAVWLPAAGPPGDGGAALAPAPDEPAAGEPGATPAVAPAPGPAAATPEAGASILVLEEETQTRSVLADALSEAGHRVDAAAGGLEGLARLERRHFDVVLTALSLPDRSGLEIAREVKRLSPQTAVVLLTGWGHQLDPARLRESGVDFMLVKPFGLERVLSVVNDAVRLRSSR